MKAAALDYVRADSAPHAVGLLAEGGGAAKVCGGSQSLGPMLNLRLAQVDTLVDVSRVPALQGHALREEFLCVGAATTHAQIEDGLLPDTTGGLLPQVAGGIAYRAVRNRGTIGGSLAHADPAADWVAVTSLLDAALVLQSQRGERRLHAGSFFLGPFTTALDTDELIVAIELPRFTRGARWAYRKFCRKPGEFAEAIAAAWIDPPRGIARVLIGALDGMPQVREGADRVKALRTPGGVAAWFDDIGLDDADKRQVVGAILRRVLADLDRP